MRIINSGVIVIIMIAGNGQENEEVRWNYLISAGELKDYCWKNYADLKDFIIETYILTL